MAMSVLGLNFEAPAASFTTKFFKKIFSFKVRIWCRYKATTSNLTNLAFTYRNDEYLGNYQVNLNHFGVYFYTSEKMLAEILFSPWFSAFDNGNINY